MNLRQKYKKAKQKLDMYEKQFKTQPIKIESRQYPVVPLKAVRRIKRHRFGIQPSAIYYETREVERMLIREASPYIMFNTYDDEYTGDKVIEGSLYLVDRRRCDDFAKFTDSFIE